MAPPVKSGPRYNQMITSDKVRVIDENGEELLNYWFSGFYPADDPRYTITVLQDGILKPETSSAAIFAKVTEILAVWENS